LASYLGKEETRASVQATLIAETVQAWLTLSADRQLARLAQDTLDGWQESLALTQRRQALGAASTLDVAAAQASVQTARADVASLLTQVDQDRNALRVLLGGELDENLLPGDQEAADVAQLPAVPADLSSNVLLRRPDVRAAERGLQAQEANVAAARAALFPSISLTSSVGQTSTTLSNLMDAGQRAWSIAPSISLPIFDGGAAKAQLQSARVDQQIALTTYQKTLQTAFEETANALSLRQRIDERLAAQDAQVQAYETVLRLTETQRKLGAASAQTVLTAQLNLYSAQKALISLRLTEQANRLTLYKVLGGV
jgi:NodT family efflux transporter outer membrane factor (OMF) lipoprotein